MSVRDHGLEVLRKAAEILEGFGGNPKAEYQLRVKEQGTPTTVPTVLKNMIMGQVSVSATAVEAWVGSDNLVGRRMLRVYNDSGVDVHFGPANTVTVSGSTRGEKISNGSGVTLMLSEDQTIWLVAGSSVNLLVQEYKA